MILSGALGRLPVPTSEADLDLMRRIDELRTELPFLGSRQLQDQLGRQGMGVDRTHVRTLKRKMGIEAIYQRKNHPSAIQGMPFIPIYCAAW